MLLKDLRQLEISDQLWIFSYRYVELEIEKLTGGHDIIPFKTLYAYVKSWLGDHQCYVHRPISLKLNILLNKKIYSISYLH